MGAYQKIREKGSELGRSPRLRAVLHLLRYFDSAFKGEYHYFIGIDRGVIDCCQPEVIIKLNGHFRLSCQRRSEGTDAVVLLIAALPFCFNGFILFLHFFIAVGVTVVTLQIFCLILYLDSILLNALADQLTYDFHILCQGSLLCIQFRAITEGSLYQVDVLQNMLSVSHQFTECPKEHRLDVFLIQMWSGAAVIAIELLIALPDGTTVFVRGMPYL